MSNNFFPDGFPTLPIEAITLSANLGFLTGEEEQGWFKWLETSTQPQQQELVETLHAIFIDHQKQNPAAQNQQQIAQNGQNQANQANQNANFDNFNQTNQKNFNNQSQQNQNGFQANGQLNQQNQQHNAANNFSNNSEFANNTTQPNLQNSQFGQNNPNFGQDSTQNEHQNWQNNPQNFENNQNSDQSNFPSNNSSSLSNSQNSQQNQQSFGQNTQRQNQFGSNNSNNFSSSTDLNNKNSFGLGQNDFEKQQSEYQKELDSFENKNSQNNNSQNAFSNQNLSQNPVKPINNQAEQNDFEFDEKIDKTDTDANLNPYSNNPSEESFLNLANSKYTPNPILDNNEPTPKEFIYQNEPMERVESKKPLEKVEKIKFLEKITEKIEPKTEDKIIVKEKIVEKTLQQPQALVEFADENDDFSFDENDNQKKDYKESVDSSLALPTNDFESSEQNTTKSQPKNNIKPFYSAPERTQLEEVYNQFVSSQKKKMDDQQEFSSHKLILEEDAWSKQSEFFGKVMEVMSNYEQMTDSLLKLNSQNIELARKIKVLENSTQARSGASLQEQINNMRSRLESLYRDFDDYRAESYRQQTDMSEQVAAATADTFKTDGIKQQIDLLANRMTRIETQR